MMVFRVEFDKSTFQAVERVLEFSKLDGCSHYFRDKERDKTYLVVSVKDKNQLPDTIKGWEQLNVI
jgi:hypothetical protein